MVKQVNASKQRKERNKERIMQAALGLFQGHGIRKTSMNDVAHSARLSPATVYNHFGSKEELVYATIKHFLTLTGVELKKIVEGSEPFPEKLEQVLLFKQDILGRYQGELLQTIVSNPKVRQYVDSVYMKEMRQVIDDFYNLGKDQGYVDKELSTETLIRYSEIIRDGMAAESTLSADPERDAELFRELLPLFLYGILGKHGDK
ncbi:TetR/AcrR family transcriptional regulator [Chloroflexota bacterium]